MSKHQIQPECVWRLSRLTRDGTAECVSRNQLLGREHGHGNIQFPCSADHVQDWKPHPVDRYHIIFGIWYLLNVDGDFTYLKWMAVEQDCCGEKLDVVLVGNVPNKLLHM